MLKQGNPLYLPDAEARGKQGGRFLQHKKQKKSKINFFSYFGADLCRCEECFCNNMQKAKNHFFFFEGIKRLVQQICNMWLLSNTTRTRKKKIHIISSAYLLKLIMLVAFYAHVGHKRGAPWVLLDVVIIRHGARQEGGAHCLLCAARPVTE